MRAKLKLKDECRFYPYDGLGADEEFVLCTPDNRQFRISATARRLLDQFDGQADLQEISKRLADRSVRLTPQQLRELVETRYGPLGIFEGIYSDGRSEDAADERRQLRKSLPLLLHWDLIPEKIVAAVSAKLQILFSRLAVFPGLALIALSHYAVYAGSLSGPQWLARNGFLPVLLLCLLSILIHEYGHASAVSRYGGRPGRIGFGLFILMPSFYADVSEIWRFSRRRRMVVDIGGIYFQQLAFAAFALTALASGKSEFVVACRFIDLMTMLALNPVFRFDGYWLLADWLALPNLYKLALGHFKRLALKALGRPLPPASPQLPRLKRHAYWVFTLYALLCNIFLLLILWVGYRYLRSTFLRLPLALPDVFEDLLFSLQAGDPAVFLDRLLTLFFLVAFPATVLVGLCRYIISLTQFLAARLRPIQPARRRPDAAA